MEKTLAKTTKRQQITQSNRVMFLWITGASMIIGFSIVFIVFLVQRISFEEKVLSKQQETVNVLNKNLAAVSGLQDNIRVLESDENLKSVLLNPTQPTVQTVLDALPSTANSTALASSLQSKILNRVPGVSIDSLRVDPVSGIETPTQGLQNSAGANAEGSISFTFSVGTPLSNQSALREVLLNVERSIRPINITSLTIESQGNRVVMTVAGVGYYQPEQKVQLVKEVVRP